MKKNVALICVDMQNDFMPGGSLPVSDGDKIIPVVNDLLPLFKTVIFTKDWHPSDCQAFASQHEGKNPFDAMNGDVLWPDHCVQNTPGADLHSGIMYGQIFGDFYIFKKGDDKNYHPYSGFGAGELEGFLIEKGIDTVYICGLATDYCCSATALDAAEKGFETKFIWDATKGISPNLEPTYDILFNNGIEIVTSEDILSAL